VKLNEYDRALARIGKSVLHLDANEYYGGSWTSFNFQELLDWAQLLQGYSYYLPIIYKNFKFY
jgi:RAB protein geranylgeranyltransferase component A